MSSREKNNDTPLVRFKPLVYSLCFIGLLAVPVSLLHMLGYGLSYQTSASMPEGWYVTYPSTRIDRGDTVLFSPPRRIDAYIVKRGWKVAGEPMLKQIFALAGDKVCVVSGHIWINDTLKAESLSLDSQSRPLPDLHLCRILAHNEYMLMSNYNAKSFDSRYFGPINRVNIVAKAKKL